MERGRARQAETHGQLHEQESWRESKQLGWEGHGIHISYIKDKHFISIFSEHRESLFKQSGFCWVRKSANSLCPCISKSIYCHLQQMHDMARLGFPNPIWFPENPGTFFTLIGLSTSRSFIVTKHTGTSLAPGSVLFRVVSDHVHFKLS